MQTTAIQTAVDDAHVVLGLLQMPRQARACYVMAQGAGAGMTDSRIVIVDLEGVASRLVSRAISQADLVLTPMRATTLDATIGIRALALVQEEEEALGSPIRHAIVFTMTRAIRSKQHTTIEASLRGQGVDVITPPLMERAAFSNLFAFGGDLRTMPTQGKMEPATENAAQFAQAVYQRLAGQK